MQQANTCTSAYIRTPNIDSGRTFTAAEVFDLVLAAYERGRFDGDILELRATWTDHDEPRLTREQRVDRRLAEMEAGHAAANATLGRPPGYRYRGGAVDWETGLPAGSLCAWLHRRRTAQPQRPALEPTHTRRHLRSAA